MGIKQKNIVTSLDNNYVIEQEVSARAAARRKKLLVRRLSVYFLFMIAICSVLVFAFFSREASLKAKEAEKIQAEEQLAKLEKQQSLLENEIVKLNDDEYIAKLARSEYFLSDKGEIIFSIPKEKVEKEKD